MSPPVGDNDLGTVPDSEQNVFLVNTLSSIPTLANQNSGQEACNQQCLEMQEYCWTNDENRCVQNRETRVSMPVTDSSIGDRGSLRHSQKYNQEKNGIPDKYRRNMQLPSSPTAFVRTDFTKEYTRIPDRETRKRYKEEFCRNYDRYRHLHCKIEKVSKRFADLESQLKGKTEGTDSYKVRLV